MKKIVFTCMMLLLLLPGLSLAGNVTGVTDDEIVLGMSAPLSGPAAAWGVLSQAAVAWSKHVNDQGGIHGRKLKIIVKDDGYNPARTIANLQQMKDKVFAVIGLLGTANCAAAKDFFPDNGIPMIHGYANQRIFARQPKEKQKWYFTAYPDYEDETYFQIKYAVENLGAKKIAQFYQNDDYGHQSTSGMEKAMKELGDKAEIVGTVPYELTERALSTHAMKLKETGADTVLLTASPTHTAIIVKTMAKIGYKPKLLASFTVADPIMHKLIGPDWVGTYTTMAGQISMPGFDPAADKAIATLMKYDPKIAGKEYLALFGAVTVMHLAEGLKNAGPDLTREKLIKGMEQIKDWRPEGMGAPITYGPDRHMGNNAVRMTQAKDDGLNHPISDFMEFDSRF